MLLIEYSNQLRLKQTGVFKKVFDVDFFKINVVESGRLNLNITDGEDMVESQIFDADGSLLIRDYYDGYRMLSNRMSLDVVPRVYY